MRPERRERDGGPVDPEHEQVGGDDARRGPGRARGAFAGGRAGGRRPTTAAAMTTSTAQKPETPAIPRSEVRGERGREAGHGGPGRRTASHEHERADEERRGEAHVVVRVDAVVEVAQLGDGVRGGLVPEGVLAPERGRRDVRDRREPGDPRRVRGQEALVAAADDEDRVAPRRSPGVPPSGGRRRSRGPSRSRARRVVGRMRAGPSAGAAAERVPHLAADEGRLGERRARLRAGAGVQEPDRAVLLDGLEVVEREARHHDDLERRSLRRAGHEREKR